MALHRSWLDFFLAMAAKTHARRQFSRFLRGARDGARIQEQVLLRKIARNADSVYGRDHSFPQIRSYENFVASVPVQTYEDLRPYVQRVMAGQTEALLGSQQRIIMFATTSGTTDQPKYVPVTTAFLREYRRGWNIFGIKALLDHPGAMLGSILQTVSPMDERRTDHGVPCGSISGLLAETQKRLVRRYYTNPSQTSRIEDPEARYYTIMRLALPRDVSWMVTASPATQLKLARAGARYCERLIRDIHDGTLTPPTDIPGDVRQALTELLEPNREAAGRLDDLLRRHGELLPKHYWRLAFLANWTGGTMGLHLRDFPHYFGQTPVRDIGLLATEGRVSIPLEDGTPAGVLDVGGSFFEFVDSDASDSNSAQAYRCHELVPGAEYRVLMTTSAGFYRYDIGDHVRVHGFVGQAPLVEFLHRGTQVSSITGEKLTEWQATEAFRRCSAELSLRITHFVLAPQWADPPFYRLHVADAVPEPQRLIDGLDEELARINVEYRSKRTSGRLGPIALSYLPEGTFDRVAASATRTNQVPNEQYKHRYLYTTPDEDASLRLVETPPPESTAESVGEADRQGASDHVTS